MSENTVVALKENYRQAAAARNKAVIARFIGDHVMWKEAQEKLRQAIRGIYQ